MGAGKTTGWPAGAVLAGIALSYVSSFGQNFLLAVFGGEIRAAFGLSHGGFGLIYTGVTLASAGLLVLLARRVDRLPISLMAGITLGMLAGASALLASAWDVVTLGIALLLLRLFGQGMSMQLSATAVARWFGKASRGRALGASAIGTPLGEASLPLLAVGLMAMLGWRGTWWLAALALALAVVPLVWLLRRVERQAAAPPGAQGGVVQPAAESSWSIAEALRHPVFYLVLPGLLAPITINIAVFFHQVALTEAKGWDPAWFVASYPVSAAATVAATLVSGWLIDKFTAVGLLPFVLLPMLAAVLLLAFGTHPLVIPGYLALAGIGMGVVMPLQAATLVEIFGPLHFGEIRAVVVAANVLLGALGPGIAGLLADGGIGFSEQLLGMAGYLVATGLLLVLGQGASVRVAATRRQASVNPA